MGKINVAADAIARVKNFAAGGDPMARVLQAILDGTRVLTLTAGAESSNIIKVLGKLTDLDGTPIKVATDIFVTSIPLAGAGTLTDGGKGTFVKGSGTVSVWLQTDANGEFEVDVTNVVAEVNLLRFELDNGQHELLKLTFA